MSSQAPGKKPPLASPLQRAYDLLVELNNLLLIPAFSIITVDILAIGLKVPTEHFEGLEELNLAICCLFFLEWGLGLGLAPNKAVYLRSPIKIADLLSSIPFAFAFKSIRIIRVVRVLRLLRVVWRMRRLGGQMREIVHVTGLVSATAVSGAVALRMIEPDTVKTFGDSMWWAIVTMSTVGYGDISPQTPAGRGVAVTMIIVGIAIFGYAVSILTSIMVDPDDSEDVKDILRRIEGRLERLEVGQGAREESSRT